MKSLEQSFGQYASQATVASAILAATVACTDKNDFVAPNVSNSATETPDNNGETGINNGTDTNNGDVPGSIQRSIYDDFKFVVDSTTVGVNVNAEDTDVLEARTQAVIENAASPFLEEDAQFDPASTINRGARAYTFNVNGMNIPVVNEIVGGELTAAPTSFGDLFEEKEVPVAVGGVTYRNGIDAPHADQIWTIMVAGKTGIANYTTNATSLNPSFGTIVFSTDADGKAVTCEVTDKSDQTTTATEADCKKAANYAITEADKSLGNQ